MGAGNVLGYGGCHKFCQIDGDGIAYHLLHIGFVADKLEVAWESLYIAAFESGEGTDSLL